MIYPKAPPSHWLVDTNVLINFFGTKQETVFVLFAKHITPLCVTSEVANEVAPSHGRQVSVTKNGLTKCGLAIINSTAEEARAVTDFTDTSLSSADKAIFFIAKQRGYGCITNDRGLRRKCEVEGIHHIWGLELLIQLHEAGALSASQAITTASLVTNADPNFFPPSILANFKNRIKAHKGRGNA